MMLIISYLEKYNNKWRINFMNNKNNIVKAGSFVLVTMLFLINIFNVTSYAQTKNSVPNSNHEESTENKYVSSSLDNDINKIFGDKQDKLIGKIYEEGRFKGIITNDNLSYTAFSDLMKQSVIPAYNEFKKSNKDITLEQYASDDNYEVPEMSNDDHPNTINISDKYVSNRMNVTNANDGYSMKAGDILVCFGTNSIGRFAGHAAIATSSKYVLEMTGYGHKAVHTSKAAFFKKHCVGGSNDYVITYRIKNHPYIARDAAKYAWDYMYKKDNPSYNLYSNLYTKSPSYCSKYVWLAYYWGGTTKVDSTYSDPLSYGYFFLMPKHSESPYDENNNTDIIRPHNIINYFSKNYKPTALHKIVSYS